MYRIQATKPGHVTGPTLTLKAAALTEQGERRPVNQDVVYHRSGQVEAGLSAGLYIVCDGLGGCRAGEVASRLAVESVTAELLGVFPNDSTARRQAHLAPSRLDEWLRFAVAQANTHLRRYAESHWHEVGGMGTTITLALIYGSTAHIVNVGDGRLYVARGGQITQVTHDHSMAAQLARAGLIDESEIATHSQRNILYRSLASQATVEADLFQWKLAAHDTLLLCSDGLWTAFPDKAELTRWLNRPVAPDVVCRQLVSEAIRRDGADDVSAVVVNVS